MRYNQLPNEIKIRRIKNQIKELEKIMKKITLPHLSSKYLNAISRRQEAVKFLEEIRCKIPWPDIQERFKFNPRFNPETKNIVKE